MLEGHANLTCQLFSSLLLSVCVHMYFCKKLHDVISARQKNPLDKTEKKKNPPYFVCFCRGGTEVDKCLLTPLLLP